MTKLNLNEAEQSDFLEMSMTIIKHTPVGFKVPVVNGSLSVVRQRRYVVILPPF